MILWQKDDQGKKKKKKKKYEFSFLPMTHILISWAHLIKLSCTVPELWQFHFFHNLGHDRAIIGRSRLTPDRAVIRLKPLKKLLQQGISEPEFYGDLVYRKKCLEI